MRFAPVTVKYILSVYITGILFFTLFRGVLIFTNFHQLQAIYELKTIMLRSMFMGFRFDTVVSGYLLAVPTVILLFSELAGVMQKGLFFAGHLLLCILYPVCFFLCAVDIPFYINYSNRLNISILNWTNSPLFMVKMVWQDNTFLGYFVLFLLTTIVFIALMSRVYKLFRSRMTVVRPAVYAGRYFSKITFSVLFLGCMMLAIRGRTDEKSPIVPGTAYFCNYNLPNQAGLNPVFNFMWSYTEGWSDENKPLTLINDNLAPANARNYLHISNTNNSIARTVTGTLSEHKYNVVVVIMESMSAYYLGQFGNTLSLTPNLDSLAKNGYSFRNFYSAGIHTFNGIFSTLYGFPALMAHHSMEGAVIPSYTGMPYFFKQRGYENIYFTTHDAQFDNVNGFLNTNHMHTIISKDDYPPAQVRSTLGVSDHDMFDYSLPLLDRQSAKHTPFFAVFMTGSNHNPYIVPPGIPFKAKHTDIRSGCVEYADWAIGYFMNKACHMPWYDSTLFVFLGDHGSYDGPAFGSMPLGYSRIPCIIYSPMFRANPIEMQAPGGQIDVFPTIAGLLGGNYTNNTMGIDLIHESRPWMFFSQDNKICVADTSDLYIWQKDQPEYMFSISDHKDILPGKRGKADSMRTYAFSMIQYAQWLRNNNRTGPGK